jgi:hypothetical protein
VLGGEVVERQQLLHVVGDLRDGLGELRAVGRLERPHGVEGVLAVLGVPQVSDEESIDTPRSIPATSTRSGRCGCRRPERVYRRMGSVP